MANILEGKKHHFLYRTTNLINGRYYIGMHSTNLLEDNYVGSGRRLWYEIRKYGRQNFKFEILEFFDSREKLALREKELVTLQEIAKEKCINLKAGGVGGFPPNAKDAFREKLKDLEFKQKYSEKCRERNLKQYEQGTRKRGFKYDWTGKRHKPETIQRQKEVKKGHGKGETNSQFGTFWITDGTKNKKTKSEIPEGWYRGRKR